MLRDCINDSFSQISFPDSRELGNIAPAHKKDDQRVIIDW